MHVKTVEQDLPKTLNPLPSIYETFGVDKPKAFPGYDQFSDNWWQEHLQPLDEFIRQYFWGCSLQFVYLGFKARLYRTLVSVLTQFHFAYTWKVKCSLPLEASAELDINGIDALVVHDETPVALQVKKETYRAEARERGRFAQRRWQVAFVVEVPYTITQASEWQRRLESARKQEKQEEYKAFVLLAEQLQRRLNNGFVVFNPDYPRSVERLVRESIEQGRSNNIGWREALETVLKESLTQQ